MRLVRLVPLLFPALLAAQAKTPTPAEQIALAVLPLPQEFRADATVLGYNDAVHASRAPIAGRRHQGRPG